jgi:hypothetical protein
MFHNTSACILNIIITGAWLCSVDNDLAASKRAAMIQLEQFPRIKIKISLGKAQINGDVHTRYQQGSGQPDFEIQDPNLSAGLPPQG